MEKTQVVETVKRERSKAGVTKIKKHAKFDATGKAKIPVLEDGEVQLQTQEEVTALLKKKDKVKKTEPKEKAKPVVTVSQLIDAVKDVEGLTVDKDAMGYVNFRDGKRIVVYAIDRKQFFNYSTRDSSTKTGWKGTRITSQEELDVIAESLRKQFTERSIRQASLTPLETFNCKFKGCQYCTNDRAQMEQHLNQH